jgi:hypothetical protein
MLAQGEPVKRLGGLVERLSALPVKRLVIAGTVLIIVFFGGRTAYSYAIVPTLRVENRFYDTLMVSNSKGDSVAIPPFQQVKLRKRADGENYRFRIRRQVSDDGQTVGANIEGGLAFTETGASERVIQPIGGEQRYVQLLISNETTAPLTILVNEGVSGVGEGGGARCDCKVKPGSVRRALGYYPLVRDFTVVAVDPNGRRARWNEVTAIADQNNPRISLRFRSNDFR